MIQLERRGPETDYAEYRKVTRMGKIFNLPAGGVVELFTIRVFAEAVERKPAVVHLWEREKKLPTPMYQLGAEGKKSTHRQYSGEQVVAANNLLRFMGIPKNGGRKEDKSKYQVDDFLRKYRKIFRIPGVRVSLETGDAYIVTPTTVGGTVFYTTSVLVRFADDSE